MDPLILTGSIVGVVAIAGASLMPVMKLAPYAYGNARIRARRATLFTREQLVELARSSHHDIVYHLEKNGFPGLIELESVGFREEEVQKHLRRRYFERLAELGSYMPATTERFFSTLASLNDYEFMITVLRSKANPFADRLLLSNLLIESEVFPAHELERISQLDANEFIMRLRSTPYRDLIEAHADELRRGELSAFERAAQEHYFTRLFAAASDRTLRSFARDEVDAFNVRTALCFEERALLPGGNLDRARLDQLQHATSLDDLARAVQGTYLEPFIRDATSHEAVVRGLLRAQRARAHAAAAGEALGVGTALSYYMDQRIELKNLRVILKLVHARFDTGAIEEAIV